MFGVESLQLKKPGLLIGLKTPPSYHEVPIDFLPRTQPRSTLPATLTSVDLHGNIAQFPHGPPFLASSYGLISPACYKDIGFLCLIRSFLLLVLLSSTPALEHPTLELIGLSLTMKSQHLGLTSNFMVFLSWIVKYVCNLKGK